MNEYASSFIECFFRAERPEVPPPERYLDKPIDKLGLLDAVREDLARRRP